VHTRARACARSIPNPPGRMVAGGLCAALRCAALLRRVSSVPRAALWCGNHRRFSVWVFTRPGSGVLPLRFSADGGGGVRELAIRDAANWRGKRAGSLTASGPPWDNTRTATDSRRRRPSAAYDAAGRAPKHARPRRFCRGSPLPHLHRDWAHPCHICTGTGLTPATSAPGLGRFVQGASTARCLRRADCLTSRRSSGARSC
jgi:hypothetical protein